MINGNAGNDVLKLFMATESNYVPISSINIALPPLPLLEVHR